MKTIVRINNKTEEENILRIYYEHGWVNSAGGDPRKKSYLSNCPSGIGLEFSDKFHWSRIGFYETRSDFYKIITADEAYKIIKNTNKFQRSYNFLYDFKKYKEELVHKCYHYGSLNINFLLFFDFIMETTGKEPVVFSDVSQHSFFKDAVMSFSENQIELFIKKFNLPKEIKDDYNNAIYTFTSTPMSDTKKLLHKALAKKASKQELEMIRLEVISEDLTLTDEGTALFSHFLYEKNKEEFFSFCKKSLS